MPLFFINSDQIAGDRCVLAGEEFHHLVHVRRTRPGRTVILADQDGNRHRCTVESVDRDTVTLRVLSTEGEKAFHPSLTLCCCLLKGGNFDLVIQKAVELGVARIIPVISERTIPHPGRGDGKKDRWERIVREAAKQCLRDDIPVIEDIAVFADVVSQPRDNALLAHTSGDLSFAAALRGKCYDAVTLLVGPEGGFSQVEVDAARGAGWTVCRYGFTQLRAETAAIALSAIVLNEMMEDEPE